MPKKKTKKAITYQEYMKSLETVVISRIEAILKDNGIIYSCNSKEFVTGLTLGIKVASEELFELITGNKSGISDTNAKKMYEYIHAELDENVENSCPNLPVKIDENKSE